MRKTKRGIKTTRRGGSKRHDGEKEGRKLTRRSCLITVGLCFSLTGVTR